MSKIENLCWLCHPVLHEKEFLDNKYSNISSWPESILVSLETYSTIKKRSTRVTCRDGHSTALSRGSDNKKKKFSEATF